MCHLLFVFGPDVFYPWVILQLVFGTIGRRKVDEGWQEKFISVKLL